MFKTVSKPLAHLNFLAASIVMTSVVSIYRVVGKKHLKTEWDTQRISQIHICESCAEPVLLFDEMEKAHRGLVGR